MPEPDPTFVYRFYDHTERLVYVGITCEPAVRWKDHAKFKTWWADVVRISAELHPSREAALAEELRAIREDLPLRNIKDAIVAMREKPAGNLEEEALAARRVRRRVAADLTAAFPGRETLSNREVAEFAGGVSVATVTRWRDDGFLQGMRLASGRWIYSRESVLDLWCWFTAGRSRQDAS